MNALTSNCRSGLLWALSLSFIAGCHQFSHSSPQNRTTSLVGGEPGKAVTKAQEADVQISLARSAEQRGAFDEAIALYKSALTRDKRRADAYQRLAILHDRKGEFQQSADLYKKALAHAPGNPDIYCDMGYSLFLQRRWVESEQNLRQAIALQPNHARAHNNLGLVLAHDHHDEEALAEYRKAGNEEPQARCNLAVALTLAGRLSEAREQYQKILNADASSAVAQARLKELDTVLARGAERRAGEPLDRQLSLAKAPPTDSGNSVSSTRAGNRD